MVKTRKKKVIKLNKTKKCLKKTKNFIFGYGSLINTHSREYTGKSYIGKPIPVILLKKAGYKRIWTCKDTKYGCNSVLGIVKGKKSSNDIVGIIAPIYKCMKNFDKREKGYKKIKIKYDPKKKNVIKALSNKRLPNYPCNIYIYVSKKNIQPKYNCPISQNYLDVVLLGCLEYGKAFAKHFIKNTMNWKNNNEVFWKNDRKNNKRYWIKNLNKKNRKMIDKILSETIPKYFKLRKN